MYIVAHYLVFFLPGFLACAMLGVRRQVFTLSFAISYCWIASLTLAGLKFGLSFEQFAGIWLGALVLLTLLAWLAERRWQQRFGDSWIASVFAVPINWFLGALTIVAVVTGWLMIVGPYTQTPADVLNHLGYIQGAIADLGDESRFSPGFAVGVVDNPPSLSWYYIVASLSRLSGLSFDSMVLQASIANTTTLVLLVFGFSAAVFARVPGSKATVLLAVLTTIFFAIHTGVNVFAYVRYYVFAPGFLLLGLYFSTIACALRFSESRGVPLFWCTLIGICTGIAALVHMQEGVFMVATLGTLAIYLTMEQRFSWFGMIPSHHDKLDVPGSRWRAPATALPLPWYLLAVMFIVSFVILFLWSHQQLPRNIVFDQRLLSIQDYLPTIRDGYFLNPFWQFYRVIGAWGLLVYLGFVISWTRMREHPFIVVGMLSPLLTVFNPIFVDLFLRHSYAQNLWRFSLLVPLVFAGALLVVHALRDLNSKSYFRKLTGSVVLGLCALTLSVDKLGPLPTWVRWHTLSQTPIDHTPEHIADVLMQLRETGARTRVITDPVTGYIVTAMTPAYNIRKKFFRPKIQELAASYFSPENLPALREQLLIINLRDASPNLTGKLSGHWPAEISASSAYYSHGFLRFVESNTQIFDLLWKHDRISLYRIR